MLFFFVCLFLLLLVIAFFKKCFAFFDCYLIVTDEVTDRKHGEQDMQQRLPNRFNQGHLEYVAFLVIIGLAGCSVALLF